MTSAARWDIATAVNLAMALAGHDHTPVADLPSLVLRPEPSDFVPGQEAQRLAASGFDLVSIPDGAHSLHYSRFTEFMSAVDAWTRTR